MSAKNSLIIPSITLMGMMASSISHAEYTPPQDLKKLGSVDIHAAWVASNDDDDPIGPNAHDPICTFDADGPLMTNDDTLAIPLGDDSSVGGWAEEHSIALTWYPFPVEVGDDAYSYEHDWPVPKIFRTKGMSGYFAPIVNGDKSARDNLFEMWFSYAGLKEIQIKPNMSITAYDLVGPGTELTFDSKHDFAFFLGLDPNPKSGGGVNTEDDESVNPWPKDAAWKYPYNAPGNYNHGATKVGEYNDWAGYVHSNVETDPDGLGPALVSIAFDEALPTSQLYRNGIAVRELMIAVANDSDGNMFEPRESMGYKMSFVIHCYSDDEE